jgi:hypothetical protein
MFIFVIPNLRELGYDSNIVFLNSLFNFIASYLFNLSSALHVWLSFLIYKKYKLFNVSTEQVVLVDN